MTRCACNVLIGVVCFLASCSPSDPNAGNSSDPARGGRSLGEKSSSRMRAAGQTKSEEADAVLRRMSDFYQQAKTVQVKAEVVVLTNFQGVESRLNSKSTVTAEKPNRLLIRSEGGPNAVDVVADGKTMTVHLAASNRYGEIDAPKSFDELMSSPVTMLMGGGGLGGVFIISLLTSKPYERLMEGVESSEFLGTTELDGVSVYHLRFTQPRFDWEAWITKGDKPLLQQVSISMSKALSGAAQGGDVTLVQRLSDWQFDTSIPADAFVFVAPAGAVKSTDLFGGPIRQERSPLVGKAAEPVKLSTLNGEEFDLASHIGRNVVMLDFWATWCGPCVQEMPLLTEVAREFAAQGVVLCAVNQREDARTVRAFLTRQKLDIQVALDSHGEAANKYDVRGLPTLVLIDKSGIIQSVHVGFRPDIQTVLRRELTEILAGKNLAQSSAAAPETPPDQQPAAALKPEGLERVWSHPGAYMGISTDSRGIYAVRNGRTCDVFDGHGQKQREFELPGRAQFLRAARLSSADETSFVAYSGWGDSILASSGDGTLLWRQSDARGIDDVWPADLDGDGLDEVIAGYNGSTGLHVFNRDGKRRWSYTRIGNVWHVCSGDLNGDGRVEVISTSAEGRVHIFTADGKVLENWQTPIYASMVRAGRLHEGDRQDTVFVVGSSQAEESLLALDVAGRPIWSVRFPAAHNHCDSSAVCRERPWIAVGMRGGLVSVVDSTGRIIARVGDQGQLPEVAWSSPESAAPLLLVATGQQLNAYRITAGAE
jgi:peroxiredoxin